MTASTSLHLRPCACGNTELFLLAPMRVIAYGRNGFHAMTMSACAHVPEPGIFTGNTQREQINGADLTMTVCTACGASQMFTNPSDIARMLEAGEPGVSRVTVSAAAPYR